MRRMKTLGVVAVVTVALTGAAAAQTRDENWARCKEVKNEDLSIGACTAIIQSGRETDASLSSAFYNRGTIYSDKGEAERAIQDLSQAIRLDPDYAAAYVNRGHAYDDKGQHDRAIQDYDQAIKLDPTGSA